MGSFILSPYLSQPISPIRNPEAVNGALTETITGLLKFQYAQNHLEGPLIHRVQSSTPRLSDSVAQVGPNSCITAFLSDADATGPGTTLWEHSPHGSGCHPWGDH